MKTKGYIDDSGDSQNAIDNYKAKLLPLDPEFVGDIKEIRNSLHIPTHLTPISDAHISKLLLVNAENNDILFSGVFTHELLNEENRDQLRKVILKIIRKYKLGMNFFTWIQWFILYKEPTTDPVGPDQNFYKRLTVSPIELFRLPKTTAQKNEIKKWFREIHKLPATGRIPAEHADYYNYFVAILNRKKPKIRRPRMDHTESVLISHLRKNHSYENIIIKLDDNLPTEELFRSKEEDSARNQTIRKRQERLQKQINKVKN